MKTQISLLALGLILSGCNGGGSGGGASAAPQDNAQAPVVTPAPTSSPTPAPTASPTPTPSSWGGYSGFGDMAHPYQVTTAEDVTHIGDYPTAYFELTGNIDMTGIAFTPITNFSGVIQGHLFALENLTIQESGVAAFALTLSGTINQLYMSSILVESTANYAAGYANIISGTLSNCQILSGTINSHLGGNGWNTGTGNPFYVDALGGSTVHLDQSTVDFNGNSFFGTF